MLYKLRHNIEDFFSGLWGSLKFFVLYIRELNICGKYYFPYKTKYNNKSVSVLANGPSLKIELESILNDKWVDDVLAVNYFANTDYFEKIKPSYYCFADPGFYNTERSYDEVEMMFRNINSKVKWPMTIFVWKAKLSLIQSRITNQNINLVGLSTLCYSGYTSYRNLFYKKGLAVPSYVNVSIMGIYALLNLGYSKIKLYGVDHSFLKNICVNDQNQLCINDSHFYGNNYYVFPPRPDGRIWHMTDYVYDKYLTFKEHEIMENYARYLGAKIINCTKSSWIDAYQRNIDL